jgi:hypothetical protein
MRGEKRMAMSNGIRREVLKQRELLWHFLEKERCFFCKKVLVTPPEPIKYGNATAPPMEQVVTIHHKNGNHADNRKANRALAHQSCHKSHHAKLVFSAWRKA